MDVVELLSHVQLFCDPMLQPTRLLCPWCFPAMSTAVGRYFHLQGIFPTQVLNLHLLRWQEPSSGKLNTWDETTGHCIPSKAKKKVLHCSYHCLKIDCVKSSDRKINNFWVAEDIELMDENCFSNLAREAFLFTFHPKVAKCQGWDPRQWWTAL